MNLMDIMTRPTPPQPWAEGDNIPWDEPAFSERMLREHLSQQHDLASRRTDVIDRHIGWIHDAVLGGRPSRVLDLACGPGLYVHRLAALGHTCTGIDFSPASVAHARRTAGADGLACTVRQEDVRTAAFGEGFDLVMMLYGQFNVFRREEAASVLARAFAALSPGGAVLIEPQRFDAIRGMAQSPATWSSAAEGQGLFTHAAHLCLSEVFWHEDASASTQRWYIVDARTGAVTRYALTNEAYTDDALRDALGRAGFAEVRMFRSLLGDADDPSSPANLVWVGRRTERT